MKQPVSYEHIGGRGEPRLVSVVLSNNLVLVHDYDHKIDFHFSLNDIMFDTQIILIVEEAYRQRVLRYKTSAERTESIQKVVASLRAHLMRIALLRRNS